MSREEIISITYDLNSATLDVKNVFQVIIEYCIENGKDIDISNKFTAFILSQGVAMPYFIESLEHSHRKYSICILRDASANKILSIF